MMNWETALTTLWNKISKPITNILIGLAILSFAPDNTSWFGWIFLAIGVGGFLDKNSYLCQQIWKKHLKARKIKEELEHLTAAEEGVLKLMVRYNKRIARTPDFEEVLSRKHGQELPSDIYGAFTGLEDKKIISYSAGGFRSYFSVTASEEIWTIIKKRYKNDFNIGNKQDK